MTANDIWHTAGAVVVALGGGAAIVFLLSSWLGRVWAERILAADKQKYEQDMEAIRARFSLSLKEYEIKTSAIQDDRKRIILLLTPALLKAQGTTWGFGFNATAFGPEEDIRESQLEAKDAREALYQLIGESRLFLSRALYDELVAVHRQVAQAWTMISAERRAWKQRKDNPEYSAHSRKTIEELTNDVWALDDTLETIVAQFRAILGTDR